MDKVTHDRKEISQKTHKFGNYICSLKHRLIISKAQKGRKHQPQEGFQKGHKVIKGTEKTRFKKGLIPWNTGKGKGTDPVKIRYQQYKSGAKIRGLVFEVTVDILRQFLKQECYYCNDKAYGIDRIDSSKGYIEGNMVPCCKVCNYMKKDKSVEDFIQKCKDVATKMSGYES